MAQPKRDDSAGDREVELADPVEDVATTGTALHKGERDSGVDLDDAPGTAGPGAG